MMALFVKYTHLQGIYALTENSGQALWSTFFFFLILLRGILFVLISPMAVYNSDAQQYIEVIQTTKYRRTDIIFHRDTVVILTMATSHTATNWQMYGKTDRRNKKKAEVGQLLTEKQVGYI